jgi:hypothetical protein
MGTLYLPQKVSTKPDQAHSGCLTAEAPAVPGWQAHVMCSRTVRLRSTRPALVLIALLVPSAAWADTLVPSNGFSTVANVVFFPLIVVVEALVYRLQKVERPWWLSAQLNIASSSFGMVLFYLAPAVSVLSGALVRGFVADPTSPLYAAFRMLAVPLVHFAMTLLIEQGLANLLRKKSPVPFKAVVRANAATYIPLMIFAAATQRFL